MLTILTFILSVVALGVNTAFVDDLIKCSLKDHECQKNMLQKVLSDYGRTGIPEYNVPIFDPIIIKDVSLPLLNLVNITLVEAKLKGLSSCEVDKFSTQIEKKRATLNITCDLTLKGNYKAFSDNPAIKTLLGGNTIKGDGKTKIKVQQINVKLDISFLVEKKNAIYI
ncbi:hypothetical protein ACJJTC_018806 [Scirpophaga incertulas]